MERLTIRIIDNLQVRVQNVHVRYEEYSCGAAFGLTLQELTINTTNERWEKQFIDRSSKDTKDLPMHKVLDMHFLALYFEAGEQCLLT